MPGLEIQQLNYSNMEAYTAFFYAVPEHLFFASPSHLAYLRSILKVSQDRTLLAMRQGLVVGALPCLTQQHADLGVVMNSLPYFGSNGGLMLLPGEGKETAAALLDAWRDLARRLHAAAWTIVENPLIPMHDIMERMGLHTLRDWRTGQITPLDGIRPGHAADDLFAVFHQKTRNMIRKAQKSGLSFERNESGEGLAALHALHSKNMTAIGGRAKPWRAFAAIPHFFRPGKDYRLYLARDEANRTVAGLLVFFCNRTAEYYTPAVRAQYRQYQPVSGLVFLAMQDAVKRGMVRWNWGGTWLNQDGVYRFKSRWGTRDFPYSYYIAVRAAGLFGHTPEELQQAFPYFYVRPFAPQALTENSRSLNELNSPF
jgi:hypothetical protein